MARTHPIVEFFRNVEISKSQFRGFSKSTKGDMDPPLNLPGPKCFILGGGFYFRVEDSASSTDVLFSAMLSVSFEFLFQGGRGAGHFPHGLRAFWFQLGFQGCRKVCRCHGFCHR